MQAILFALISLFSWTFGDILLAITSRRIGGYSLNLWTMVAKVAIMVMIMPFFIYQLQFFTWYIFLLTLFLSFLFVIGQTALYEGISKANSTVIATIGSSFIGVIVILSLLFLRERPSVVQLLAILIIFVGVILTSLKLNDLKKFKLSTEKGVTYAVIASLTFGIYLTFIKYPVSQIGWYWPLFFLSLPLPFFYYYMKKRNIVLKSPKIYSQTAFLILLAAIINNTGTAAYNYAIGKGLVSIIAPIAGSSVVLFILLLFIIFRDKISRQQILGVILTITGVGYLIIVSK